MINHARTLLLNLPGDSYGGQPGDEFIPPTYTVATLPSFLQQTRDVLFGPDPHRVTLNYYTRQLLGMLHATELEEFVTILDQRITYDVLPGDELFDSLFQVTVTPLGGTTSELFIQGREDPADDTGPLQRQWLVEITGPTTATVISSTPPSLQETIPFTVSSGLSSTVPLSGSAIGVKCHPLVGDKWHVESARRPSKQLGQILAELDTLTEDIRLELFAVGTTMGAEEPFKTFYNLYRYHPEMSYRLGGLLLAMIYQTDLLVKESVTRE